MKIVKRWLNLKWHATNRALDVEENDLGQLRNKKAGSDNWATDWKEKNADEWNAIFLKALENTPPDEDYTTPSEEQLKSIDALKKWMNDD